MKRRFTDFIVRLAVAGLLSAGLARPAFACACCSEPGLAAHGLGAALYKEWRAQALAKLTGILALHGAVARAELILHGRGRSCTSAPDFDSWTLVLRGKGIRFTFLGTTVQ